MARVYSKQFFCQHLTEAESAFLEVPDGQVWIMRDFSATYAAGDPSTAYVQITTVLGSVVDVWGLPLEDDNVHGHIEGRLVLEAGDQVQVIQTTVGTVLELMLCGYVLSLP